MKLIKNRLTISIILTGALLTGCTPTAYNNTQTGGKTQQGALLGAVAGAVIAGVTARKGERRRKILQGALMGGVAGGVIGYSMDKQAEQMAKALGTNVDNSPNAQANMASDIIVSKRDNFVQLTFRDNMMFDTNSAYPTSTASSKIAQVGAVLRQYPQTVVQVVGHTDNRGSYAYNKTLSQNRASNVANTIKNSGISNRVTSAGCSFNKSIVPNTSAVNMGMNRRVEIYLYPNQQLVTNQCR